MDNVDVGIRVNKIMLRSESIILLGQRRHWRRFASDYAKKKKNNKKLSFYTKISFTIGKRGTRSQNIVRNKTQKKN